jgi:hypothetical protein
VSLAWYCMGHAVSSVILTHLSCQHPELWTSDRCQAPKYFNFDSHSVHSSPKFLVLSFNIFSTMPNQHKPCCLFFFCNFFLAKSSQIKLVAPLTLIEPVIWQFHSQGVSIPKMVHLLKKHYDMDTYGIG